MSFMIVDLIQYFFLQIVYNNITQTLKSLSTSHFFARGFSLKPSTSFVEKKHDNNIVNEESLHRDDVEVLMTNLGVFRHLGDEKLPLTLNSNDLFNIFEQEEPRLDEVKEAFGVFDSNKDGFIDANELQRVLFVLGFKDSANVEECKKMIGVFDLNADGRIDFNEFVKFMENTYC